MHSTNFSTASCDVPPSPIMPVFPFASNVYWCISFNNVTGISSLSNKYASAFINVVVPQSYSVL